MSKEEILDKLKELGIITTNAFSKNSFLKHGDIYVGLFKREMAEDFYFYNSFQNKIFKFPKTDDTEQFEKEKHMGSMKYLVPLYKCEVIWEDREFVELPDDKYINMSLRQYACIQMRHPNSGVEWLDVLIKESNARRKAERSSGGLPI